MTAGARAASSGARAAGFSSHACALQFTTFCHLVRWCMCVQLCSRLSPCTGVLERNEAADGGRSGLSNIDKKQTRLVVMYYLTIFIVKSVVCFTVAQLLQSQGEVKSSGTGTRISPLYFESRTLRCGSVSLGNLRVIIWMISTPVEKTSILSE